MSTDAINIRRVGPTDAREVLDLVKADFARVAVGADIEGVQYSEPTQREVKLFQNELLAPKQRFRRMGAYLNEKLIVYAKYGPLAPPEMEPYFNVCTLEAFGRLNWYKDKTGLYTLATDGHLLDSPEVKTVVDRLGLFTTQEMYIPSLVGDTEMAEFLTEKGARSTELLGDAAIRNVTRHGRKLTTELWNYKPPVAT